MTPNNPIDKSKQTKTSRLSPKGNPASVLQNQGRGWIASDTQGSYTGTPEEGYEPEQDADDL